MSVLDIVIVVGLFAAALGGWRVGLLSRISSWLGMAIGLAASARIVSSVVLPKLEDVDSVQLLLVAAVCLMTGAFLGQLLGLSVSSRLAVFEGKDALRAFERSLGGAAGMTGVLAAVWLFGPALTTVSDLPGELASNSAITRTVTDVLPTAPDPVDVIRWFIGDDSWLPSASDPIDPPTTHDVPGIYIDRAANATVRLFGIACSRVQEGTGFVIGDDLVITNAHVVAGHFETEVETQDGLSYKGEVIAFDPARDLAVLRVRNLEVPPLPIGSVTRKGTGAVMGHPMGGELDVRPYGIARRVTATGWDLYNISRTERQVYFLASDLQSGDSGAALINAEGEVAGIVFAIAPDEELTAFALTAREIKAVLANVTDSTPSVGETKCLK